VELACGDYRGGGGERMRDELYYNEARCYGKLGPGNSSYSLFQ